MIDYLSALVLGIVEGITEFLPISSTGHLILVNQWVHLPAGFEKTFDVVIQLGAILAVVIHFWDRLWPFGKKPAGENKAKWALWGKVLVAVVPALVFGFLLDDFIEERLFNPLTVAIALVAWGLVIILVEAFRKPKAGEIASANGIGYGLALAIGFAQCLAMVPGTSRSAATIICAMLLGCSRVAAAEFSFFLAIPTMAAATGYSLLKAGWQMTAHEAGVLALGFAVSFAVAFVVIKLFMSFVSRHKFTAFGVYRVILGTAVALLLLL